MQYKLRAVDKHAKVTDQWVQIKYKAKLKSFEKDFLMLKEYMTGKKPQLLSKQFKIDIKKVYNNVQQFKAFMEKTIHEEENGRPPEK